VLAGFHSAVSDKYAPDYYNEKYGKKWERQQCKN
jgi:hypothetical protein